MKIIDWFLKEQKELFQGRDFKKNAPTFAWETVHNKSYKGFKSGRIPGSKEKLWNGIYIDYNLKEKWLKDLNNIKEIEIRSSCQGHPPKGEWPSFVIFRMIDNSKYNVKNIVNKLHNGKDTFCKYEIGNNNQIRICVATLYYYGCEENNKWEKWWNTLSDKIKKSLV